MKKSLGIAISILMLLALVTTSAAAQSYYFSVPQEIVNVAINNDGTYSIDYVLTFVNDSSGHVIDFVDIGMPNGNYSLSSVTADVNGVPVGVSSDYQGDGSYGFAVDMGSQAIQPGQAGSVHVNVPQVSDVLFVDDQDETYASMEFSPTWFGSEYVSGKSNISVSIHLPAAVQSEEGRYHTARGGWPGTAEPAAALDNEGRVTYTWQSPDASISQQYYFGASFPAQYVPAGIVAKPTFADRTGVSIDSDSVIGFLFCCGFGFFMFGLPIIGVFNERKRKMQYLSPKISIEGHGIKRGLTAVEAAILMQQPLDKVMTMILFAVVKKGAAEVVSREPLNIKVIEPLPENLHEYEKNFLEAFKFQFKAEQKKALQKTTVGLVRGVEDKMRGFSRKETLEYYKAIMERAWAQVEAADTPEVQSKMFDEALEWTMLDKDYDDRTRRTITRPIFAPMWWGNYDPTWHGGGGVSSAPTGGGIPTGSRGGLPGSAIAATMVSSAQSFAGGIMGNVQSFTSGVTGVTNPPPPPSRSSGSRSGGGGGCACACACAGCACACAGGGR